MPSEETRYEVSMPVTVVKTQGEVKTPVANFSIQYFNLDYANLVEVETKLVGLCQALLELGKSRLVTATEVKN